MPSGSRAYLRTDEPRRRRSGGVGALHRCVADANRRLSGDRQRATRVRASLDEIARGVRAVRVVRSAQQPATVLPRARLRARGPELPTHWTRYSTGRRDSIPRTPTSCSVSPASPFARTKWPRRGGRRTQCSRAIRPTPTRSWWPDSWPSGRAGRRTHGNISSARSPSAETYVDVHIALGRDRGRRRPARRGAASLRARHRTGSVEARGARRVARPRRRTPLMRIVWSRAIAGGFWFATAAYCLLSAIPFASEQFLKPGLVPALVIVRGMARVDLSRRARRLRVALAPWPAVGPSRRARRSSPRGRWPAWRCSSRRRCRSSQPSTTALALALLSLVPPASIALMDLPRARRNRRADAADGRADAVSRDFAACALAAARRDADARPARRCPPCSHLACGARRSEPCAACCCTSCVFSGVFAAICVVRGAARLMSPRAVVEAWAGAMRPRDRAGGLPLAQSCSGRSRWWACRGAVVGRRVRRGAGGGVRPAPDGRRARPRPGAERPRPSMGDAVARGRDRLAGGGRRGGLARLNDRRRRRTGTSRSPKARRWRRGCWRWPRPFASCRCERLAPASFRSRCASSLLGLNAAVSRVSDGSASAADVWKGRDPSIRLDRGRARAAGVGVRHRARRLPATAYEHPAQHARRAGDH